MAQRLKDRLTGVLLQKGLLSQQDLSKALEIQKTKGGSLGDLLVGMGLVDQQALLSVLSKELHIPPINLAKIQPDKSLTKIIPQKLALYYQVVPVSMMGKTLTVAMADPLNVLALDDIASATGLTLTLLIAVKEQIQTAIQEMYGNDAAEMVQDLVAPLQADDVLEVVEISSGPAHKKDELIRMTQETPVVRVTDSILQQGVAMRASDILIEPFEDKLRIRYRIDGLLQEIESPPIAMHEGIVSRIKVVASLDIAEHRLPQDGRFQIKLADRPVDFRVSIVPSSFGEKVVLRVLDRSQTVLDMAKLGFDGPTLKTLQEAGQRPHGMILVTGPTGAGKSTTLYCLLKFIDSPAKNLVTVEDPVEYQMAGVNQVAINTEVGLTFAASLRSILRQDPNIIMIGEIRDGETADIAIKAALTGHLVLSTLHTNDAIGAVARLMNMGVEPFLISSSLILVGAQRLLRRICSSCKEPVPLPAHLAQYFRMEEEKEVTVYRGKGCKSCKKSGYLGRVGIMETLKLDSTVREMVTASAKEPEIRGYAKKIGMASLRDLAVKKMLEGVTTPDEALRVTVGV
ncbi:MAG: Flp pilus assembly complex ATPase component TadA [Candidatus Omnitrophica bacterium]|nr:Flp pilus assembly complex ATPase component TadA [Candidatus Omnitrophota bacterium]